MISRERIAEGVHNYLNNEIIPNISNTSVKLIIGTVSNGVLRNPEIIDQIMNHPIVSVLIQCENDEYDLEWLIDSVCESMSEHGNLTITIPKVPLLIPNEQKMILNRSDIQKLKNYIV